MLKSCSCSYSDGYILVKGTITVSNIAAADTNANSVSKKVIIKKFAPFTKRINEINNTQVDNANNTDSVMPMYKLIEYNDNYSKTSGSLWQYCKGIWAVNNNGDIVDFNEANITDLFNFKENITGKTGDDGINDVKIMVPWKYLSNFWRTLEMSLINCEINFILTWSANCVIASTAIANQGPKF